MMNRYYVDEKYGNKKGYWRSTAKNIDIWANREFRALWNFKLISEVGNIYKFGVDGETISSALGKNELNGTLSTDGKRLVKLLNSIEKNHCILWIDKSVGNWFDPRNT